MAVDFSPWNGPAVMSAGAKSDNPTSFYKAVCAGTRSGDPALQSSWALPYKKTPASGPNADGVRNALARLPQTQGLTNKAEAQSKLEAALKEVQAAEAKQKANAYHVADLRAARAEAVARGELPGGPARAKAFTSQMRGGLVTRDGRQLFHVEGYATVFNRGYTMWDAFGSYEEVCDPAMLNKSLASGPDVAFLVNHKGVTMARSTNGSLLLNADSTGLHCEAWLNYERQDVRDLAIAMNDELVDQMSFAFRLNDGIWSDDYSEFRITEADINRGDVSAVNFGANPYTSIAARSADILEDLEHVPVPVAMAAIERMQARLAQFGLPKDLEESPEPEPVPEVRMGKSLTVWRMRFE